MNAFAITDFVKKSIQFLRIGIVDGLTISEPDPPERMIKDFAKHMSLAEQEIFEFVYNEGFAIGKAIYALHRRG